MVPVKVERCVVKDPGDLLLRYTSLYTPRINFDIKLFNTNNEKAVHRRYNKIK